MTTLTRTTTALLLISLLLFFAGLMTLMATHTGTPTPHPSGARPVLSAD
jgi:hypothetical protein